LTMKRLKSKITFSFKLMRQPQHMEEITTHHNVSHVDPTEDGIHFSPLSIGVVIEQ